MPEMNADAGTTQNTGTEATATSAVAQDATQQTAAVEPQKQTEAPAADATKTEAEEATKGAPEKYEFVQPEGQALPDSVVASLSDVARELNLPQAEAQKLIDKLAPAYAQHNADTLTRVKSDWREQLAADKEIGGAGLEENKALAAKVFTDFGSPELGEMLDKTGLGDNPLFVKWAVKVGKAISEDRAVPGTRAAAEPPKDLETRAAKSLYGNTA